MNTTTANHKTTVPPTAHEIHELKLKDYSDSLTIIAQQIHILEHALPLGNPEQIEKAFKKFRAASTDLRMFLVTRGYDV